ncbi:MAG: hypothetical protein D6773_10860 [Alphaproteobacteria bacterium]|nr:MAG: hypothetical protein D6773_10860 [Alphaproteobacteria bacterium]
MSVHHLGDDVVAGWPPAKAGPLKLAFHLPFVHGPATLHIDVMGTQAEHNEVFVNGERIGHLRKNPSNEEFAQTDLKIPAECLRQGSNRLVVMGGIIDDQPGEPDDFLVSNIHLHAAN